MNKNNISDIAALKRGSIFQQPNRRKISRLKSYNFRFQNLDFSQSIASQKLQSIERSLDQTQEEVVKSYLQTDSQRKPKSQQKCLSDVRINRIFTPNLTSSDVVPIWLQQRKDYLKMSYSQKIQNFLHIPKICLKQSRTYTEIANLQEWVMNQKSLNGFPQEFYDKFTKYLKTYVINQGEIVQLGEMKLIVYSGVLEFKKKIFISGDILQQEYLNAIGKQDSILLGLDNQDLHIILEQIRKNQSEQFINKLKTSRVFQMMEKYEIHKMVGKGIFVMYFKDEILNCNDDQLLIIFSGSVQMQISSYVNKSNRWPVGTNAWEIKQYIQNRTKVFILKECQCMSYISSGDEKYVALENTLILSIEKKNLEEISTQETIHQISQQIQQQFQDSTNWKQKVRKRFNEELQIKKLQLQKVMKQLLEESCPSDLN